MHWRWPMTSACPNCPMYRPLGWATPAQPHVLDRHCRIPPVRPTLRCKTLHKAVRQVAASPAMIANLKDRGVIPPEEMTPAAFEKMMAERMVKFGDVVKRAGIKAE